MLKYSSSLAMKKMQIKTILRFHLPTVRVAKMKETKNNKCWEQGTLFAIDKNQTGTATVKIIMKFPQMVEEIHILKEN